MSIEANSIIKILKSHSFSNITGVPDSTFGNLFNLLENEFSHECVSEYEAENILIQEYIPGKEYAVEGIIEKGQFKLIAIFEKPIPLTGPYFEETIYISDPNFDQETKNSIISISQNHIESIGISEGAVHLEYRINIFAF